MIDREFTKPPISGNPTAGSTASFRVTRLREPSAMPTEASAEFDRLTELAHKLVRVPKSELDEKREGV
jgi:hypothetical protein